MDLATIIGLVGSTSLVMIVMMMAGTLGMFIDVMSAIVVVGGAMMATLVRWPLKNFLNGTKIALNAVFNKVTEPSVLIDKLEDLSKKARQNSVLALEKEVIEDPFLAKGIKLLVDGQEPASINEILDTEMNLMRKRHKDGIAIMENLGEACPAFGMIGTVIGLIVIMANLTDPDKIGPGLAVALITTLYGAMIANMVFIPLSSKLKFRSTAEMMNMQIIKNGINSIISGENPRTMREKLEAFLKGN